MNEKSIYELDAVSKILKNLKNFEKCIEKSAQNLGGLYGYGASERYIRTCERKK
jgi:hypothetical protein